MERALLGTLIPGYLDWLDVISLAEEATGAEGGVKAATNVAWRRAATSLRRKGLVDLAYLPQHGARRVLAVRPPASARADSDAFAIAAVRRAVSELRDYQRHHAFVHGMVFAFTRWDGQTSADDALRWADQPPQSRMLANPTGYQRRYPYVETIRDTARLLIRMTNWTESEGQIVLHITWLNRFLEAAASDSVDVAMTRLTDEVAAEAEAWFWGELPEADREELISRLPASQGLGKRGVPPENARGVVRTALFDERQVALPLGYFDLRANLFGARSSWMEPFTRTR